MVEIRSQSDVPPEQMAQVPPSRHSDANAYMMQAVFELTSLVGRIDARTIAITERIESLKASTDATNDKIAKLESQVTLAKGFLICAVLLVPLCFTILWWSLGERIEQAILKQPAAIEHIPTK